METSSEPLSPCKVHGAGSPDAWVPEPGLPLTPGERPFASPLPRPTPSPSGTQRLPHLWKRAIQGESTTETRGCKTVSLY